MTFQFRIHSSVLVARRWAKSGLVAGGGDLTLAASVARRPAFPRKFLGKFRITTRPKAAVARRSPKGLRRLFAAGHDHFAGADGFDDIELGEHGDGGIDLRAVAVEHDDHGGGC